MSATSNSLPMMRPPARYAAGLRALHWLVAALVVVMFVLGLWIRYFPPKADAVAHSLYNLHESTGVTIWVLMIARLIVRLATGSPELPGDVPPAARILARVNQAGMYALLFAMPIVGFLDANAAGAPLVWYEAVPVPSPIGKQPDAVAGALSGLHWWGAMVLLVLIALHLSGALYHGAVRRDGVVRHMA